MFFVLEGIDGSGKSTQIGLLYNHIRSKNMKVVMTHEPTNGAIGRMIKRILRGKEKADTLTLQMLFIADRADHIDKFISPNMKNGGIVLSDRYFYSTIAFGKATGLDDKWLSAIFSKFLMPNAVIFIDVDPKRAIERIEKRGIQSRLSKRFGQKERHDNLETLTKTRMEYLKLQKNYKNYFIVDGNRSIKEVSKDIIAVVDKILQHAPVV